MRPVSLSAEPGAPVATSVALVALLEPGVAPVVVAVLLPEPGLVVVQHPQPRHPLGALPEVEVGHEQAGGAAVLAWQRRPSNSHTTQAWPPVTSASGRLVVYPLCEKAITWVAAGSGWAAASRVSTDTPAEADAELRPGGDAVDVPDVRRTAGRGSGPRSRSSAWSTRPSTVKVHVAVSSFGVASAVSTGQSGPTSYWPGGRRGSRGLAAAGEAPS